MSYTHTITVPLAWDEALQQAKEALAEQGFGILSEINVRATFEAKLGSEAATSLGDYADTRLRAALASLTGSAGPAN